MENPLLDTSSLPRFDEIQPDHVLPAIRKVIADNRAALDRLLDSGRAPNIDALVAPIEHTNSTAYGHRSAICRAYSARRTGAKLTSRRCRC